MNNDNKKKADLFVSSAESGKRQQAIQAFFADYEQESMRLLKEKLLDYLDGKENSESEKK